MSLNVLITAGSRRVPLVRAFQRAVAHHRGGNVIVTDVNPLSPAVHAANRAYRVPLSAAPGYIDAILDICLGERVSLVVPTIDDELVLFGGAVARFRARHPVAVSPRHLGALRRQVCTCRYLHARHSGGGRGCRRGRQRPRSRFIAAPRSAASARTRCAPKSSTSSPATWPMPGHQASTARSSRSTCLRLRPAAQHRAAPPRRDPRRRLRPRPHGERPGLIQVARACAATMPLPAPSTSVPPRGRPAGLFEINRASPAASR
jgi:hypothetical protein